MCQVCLVAVSAIRSDGITDSGGLCLMNHTLAHVSPSSCPNCFIPSRFLYRALWYNYVMLTNKMHYIYIYIHTHKVKFSRYRPGVSQSAGRGITLLFHDRGTRRGEWSAARPDRTLPPGKTQHPSYRRLGGPQGRSGRAENIYQISAG